MDGYPRYHQPAPSNWYRMLFLCTSFVIGGMCLWAFVQKRAHQQQVPVAQLPPVQQHAPAATATQVLERADYTPGGSWNGESPAHAMLQSSQTMQAEVPRNQGESAVWHVAKIGLAQQASFETEPTTPVHVAHAEPFERAYHPAATEIPAASLGDAMPAYQVAPSTAPQPRENVPEVPAAKAHASSIITVADDSFWNIAGRVYGDPRYYRALFEYNRNWIAYPDRIEEGFSVMTPTLDVLHEKYGEFCPAK